LSQPLQYLLHVSLDAAKKPIDWTNGDNFEGFNSKKSKWVFIYQIESGIVTQ